MSEHKHIYYFKVENFKRFSSFEMNNIGQYNLIVGDNNVGKTSLLEAMLFSENTVQLLIHFLNALTWRGVTVNKKFLDTNYLRFFLPSAGNKIIFTLKYDEETKNNSFKNNQKLFSLEIKDAANLTHEEIDLIQKKIVSGDTSQKYFAILNNGDKKDIEPLPLYITLSKRERYSPFVPFHLGYQDDLVGFYSEKIQPSKKLKDELIENLKIFIPEIADIEISTNVIPEQPYIVIRLINRDETMPLTMFGDGAVKLFRILCEIAMCKGNRLMIDEIDTGVYYGRFKKYWMTILKAAELSDVQIFATTHSIDCLKYLNEALFDDETKHLQSKARVFSLKELPDKTVKAYGYDFEKFNSAIENEIEIRG